MEEGLRDRQPHTRYVVFETPALNSVYILRWWEKNDLGLGMGYQNDETACIVSKQKTPEAGP